MHTCVIVFLKEGMLQSCRYTIIDIHVCLLLCPVNHPYWEMVIDIPPRKFGGCIPISPMVDAYASGYRTQRIVNHDRKTN